MLRNRGRGGNGQRRLTISWVLTLTLRINLFWTKSAKNNLCTVAGNSFRRSFQSCHVVKYYQQFSSLFLSGALKQIGRP